MSVVKLECSEP